MFPKTTCELVRDNLSSYYVKQNRPVPQIQLYITGVILKFDFINFLKKNGTDCLFDWKLTFVPSSSYLVFQSSKVEDLIMLGNHYFLQYRKIQFNYISSIICFVGGPVDIDPTYGFPFWKVAVIVASLAAAGIVAAIVTCIVRNKRLRREMSEWKRGKEE